MTEPNDVKPKEDRIKERVRLTEALADLRQKLNHPIGDVMSDDNILSEAAKIKRRRLNEARLASLDKATGVMIRWGNPGAPFGESYTSIDVSADDVRELVQAEFVARIMADRI